MQLGFLVTEKIGTDLNCDTDEWVLRIAEPNKDVWYFYEN